MLVLTRKPDSGDSSTITIGDGVEITVLEVRGDQVRLGITAPKDTPVHRKEIWVQLHAAPAE